MIRPRFVIAIFVIAFVALGTLMIAIGHERMRITRASYATYIAFMNDPLVRGTFVTGDVPTDATAIKYFDMRGIRLFELTFSLEENSFVQWAEKLGDIDLQSDPQATYLRYDTDDPSGSVMVDCKDCRNIEGRRPDGTRYQALFNRAIGRVFFQIWYPYESDTVRAKGSRH